MASLRLQVGDTVAIDTTGVKLTDTIPAGKSGMIQSYSMFSAGTLYVWDIEVVRGAATITVFRSTAAQNKNVDVASIPLQGGDVVNFRISTVGAGGNTGDLTLGIVELAPGER